MEIRYINKIYQKDLVDLYTSVGWSRYTESPELLQRAVRNSTFVVSMWEDLLLVGLARCISDGATIMYLQDVLIRPEYQKRGRGSLLIKECLKRFAHVRQIVLLTDDAPDQLSFYRKLGLTNTKDTTLNAFVRIKD